MLRVLYGTSIGGRGATSGSYFHLGVKGIWSPCLMAYLLEEGCNVLSAYQSLELECLDRYRHILLRRLLAPTDWHVLFVFASLLLGRQLLCIAGLQWAARYRAIMEVWHFLQAAEEVMRAGVFQSFVHQVVRA